MADTLPVEILDHILAHGKNRQCCYWYDWMRVCRVWFDIIQVHLSRLDYSTLSRSVYLPDHILRRMEARGAWWDKHHQVSTRKTLRVIFAYSTIYAPTLPVCVLPDELMTDLSFWSHEKTLEALTTIHLRPLRDHIAARVVARGDFIAQRRGWPVPAKLHENLVRIYVQLPRDYFDTETLLEYGPRALMLPYMPRDVAHRLLSMANSYEHQNILRHSPHFDPSFFSIEDVKRIDPMHGLSISWTKKHCVRIDYLRDRYAPDIETYDAARKAYIPMECEENVLFTFAWRDVSDALKYLERAEHVQNYVMYALARQHRIYVEICNVRHDSPMDMLVGWPIKDLTRLASSYLPAHCRRRVKYALRRAGA